MQKFLAYSSNVLTILVGLVALFVLGSLVPIEGNYQFKTVLSGSMEPAIDTGSVVVIIPAQNYNVGDVVTFAGTSINPTPTTHRIVGIEDGLFITKGDANEEPDYRQIRPADIIGKVWFSVPKAGYLSSYLSTENGTAVLVALGIVLVAGMFLPWRTLLKRPESNIIRDHDHTL